MPRTQPESKDVPSRAGRRTPRGSIAARGAAAGAARKQRSAHAAAARTATASMSRASRPPLTVHCHQHHSSPLGPGSDARTQVWRVEDGSDTYTRWGSIDTCGLVLLDVSDWILCGARLRWWWWLAALA